MPEADAILIDEHGRSILRFERPFPHPPERVWKALIEPEELAAWHPSPCELEPRVGGPVTYIKSDAWPEMEDGVLTAYEPPRRLGYTWGGDDLRWELLPRGDGCLLIPHPLLRGPLESARDAAGWHLCLAALLNWLDHEQRGSATEEGRLPQGWQELNSQFEERFAIEADKATPPPR